MPDYRKMYLEMIQQTEKAIQILVDVQRRCEEIYIDSPEPEVQLLHPAPSDSPERDWEKG